MDKASITGVVVGVGLVLGAIVLGSSLGTFVNLPGLLIVVGGTFAATSIAFPTNELKWIWPVSRRVFNDPGNEIISVSQFILEAMGVMRREGRIALERVAGDAPTAPLRKGLLLIADGMDSATIRTILSTEQKTMVEHHRAGQKIFTEMGKFAPAFGMIGTLIGLVQMLAELDDPSSIGPAMAVALLTTFYGAVLANLIFLPMVTKLERRIQIEVAQIQLAIVGLDAMNREDSVVVLKEKLNAFLNEHDAPADAELDEAA